MTFGELERAITSRDRVKRLQDREKATFNYILADLIGRSVSRIYNSSNKIPPIYEVYPSLFSAEEEQEALQKKKAELSVLRFRQFAETHNKKYGGGIKSE